MMELEMTRPTLLLGRQTDDRAEQHSAAKENPDEDVARSLDIDSEGMLGLSDGSNVLTISADARERLRASIIPNLLSYPGSVVVVDLSGEAYEATAKTRRDMGQAVVRLDPFRVVDEGTDALDPLDLLEAVDGSAVEGTCQDIASLFPGFHAFADLWDGHAFGLLSGVIGYLGTVPEKNFADLYNAFHNEDVVYNLAVVLDTIGKKIPKMSYSEIAYFLQREDAERKQMQNSVVAKIKAFSTEAVQEAFKQSTVALAEIMDGKPVSVYLMIPPEKMSSHSALLNIWIGTLLRCARDRRFQAEIPMLFLLDQTAKLLPFPQMQAAMTSPIASQLRIWTFWEDVQQLRTTCPGSWMFDNCGAMQVFGTKDFDASNELAAALGVESKMVQSLATYEQVVAVSGTPYRTKKIDYRADPLFKGAFE